MSDTARCEYCRRLIIGEPVNKKRRGKERIFCSEFCFRLDFYDVPTISYDDMKKMYAMYCVSLPADEYHRIIDGLLAEEDKR
jgi:hypothetical protein